MKRQKRLTIYLLSILLSLAIFTFKSNSVKAASTVKLYLNHNSYVYNNKGQRLYGKGTYFKKKDIVTAPGSLKTTDTIKRYYTRKDLLTKISDITPIIIYWLPYKVINKKYYYRIGKNRYIKCFNVKAINNKDNDLFTTHETVIVQDPKKINEAHIYAEKDEKTGPYDKAINAFILPKYKKLVIDNINKFINRYADSYHIKGTDYYVYSGDLVKTPRHLVIGYYPSKIINGKKYFY